MSKNTIPANAHNKVVAGENAKELTKEILEGIVRKSTRGYIDNMVDATWEYFDEYSQIETDEWDNLWVVDFQFNEGSIDAIWQDIDEECSNEGYDINTYDWCKEHDIDLEHMIDKMANEIVEDDDELDWFRYGWEPYLGVFYKSSEEVENDK